MCVYVYVFKWTNPFFAFFSVKKLKVLSYFLKMKLKIKEGKLEDTCSFNFRNRMNVISAPKNLEKQKNYKTQFTQNTKGFSSLFYYFVCVLILVFSFCFSFLFFVILAIFIVCLVKLILYNFAMKIVWVYYGIVFISQSLE